MKNLILLISCVTLVACSVSIPFMQSTPKHPDLAISMARGGCRGACPMYALTIHANGTVEYEGIKFVNIEGKRNSKINASQMEELVTAIENADFFSLEDEYVTPATDLSSITLSITLDGQTQSVWHYGFLDCGSDNAPQELCELESKIEEVANSKQWVK